MPLALPQEVLDQAFRLGNTNPWVWLMELVVERTVFATVKFRFVNSNVPVPVEFPAGSGKRYYPYPFRAPDLPSDSEGSVPKLTVILSSGGYEGIRYMDARDGLVGNDISLWRVNLGALASASFGVLINGRVSGVVADASAIQLTIGLIDLFKIDYPRDLWQRDRCRHRFTGPGCLFRRPGPSELGYGLPEIMFCDKTLLGPGGCKVHGDNEVARGLTRNHPAQYGGAYSIPIGRRES